MISTGVWEGCFIPDFVAIKVLGCITQAEDDSRWSQWRELLLWLLVVTGALTRKNSVRAMALMMIRENLRTTLSGMYDDWYEVEMLMKTFVWSSTAMEQPVRRFWEELRE